MWIVRLALRRPYTFVVMAFGIMILGALTIARMPTDIFPEIDIPVISIVWNYNGLPPEEMERRIIGNYERFLTTTVNDIEHVESQSLQGVGVIKVFLQPGAKLEAATAQITAVSQTAVRQMPPGATPPLIIRYSASNVRSPGPRSTSATWRRSTTGSLRRRTSSTPTAEGRCSSPS